MDPLARLKDLAVSESGFLFDPYTGLTFSVNGTGKAIIEALRRGVSAEDVPRELAAQFALGDGDDPGRDVSEYLLMLREAGLIPREQKP